MSTRNKKAGKLNPSDLNVTSVCFCQCVGKLHWCCLQLVDMAEGSTHPPEPSKVSSSSPVQLCCSALCRCSRSCTRAAWAQIAFELVPVCCEWRSVDPHAGRGRMVCDTPPIVVMPWGVTSQQCVRNLGALRMNLIL